jgi:hypothetical protein
MNGIIFTMNRHLISTAVIGVLVIALALLATPVAAVNMPPSYHPDVITKQVYQEKITSSRPSVDVIIDARYLRGATYLSPGRWFNGSCR